MPAWPSPAMSVRPLVAPPSPLVRAATLIAVATVASRLLGLGREMVAAALFGASDAKAAYVIGYYLPFFVQRLLIGGTLAIVLIPTLSGAIARGDDAHLQRVSSQLFTAVLLVGVIMVAAGQVAAPLLVPLAAPGFAGNAEQLGLTVMLTRVNFLAMFFLALAIFSTAYLNAHRRFLMPAVAPLAFNLTIIAGALLLGPRIGIVGLAVAWVAGTAVQFLVQAPALRAAGFRWRLALDWSSPEMQTVRRLALPTMVGLAVVEINAYVGRFLASLLPTAPGVNAIAALDYAYEVVQAPIGILAISLATVLFPSMSQQAASGDVPALRRTLAGGLRGLLFLTVPISAGLVAFARPAVQLVFERGEFGSAATAMVAWCLTAYAVGLVPMAAYYVVTRTFYARHDMRTPVTVGAAMVILNALLATALMRVAGAPGIALAAAIVSVTNVGLLLVLLRGSLGGLDGRKIAATAWRVTLAAAVAVGVGWAAASLAVPDLRLRGSADLLAIGGAGAGSAVLYLAACRLLRVEEVRLLRSLVRRRPLGDLS